MIFQSFHKNLEKVWAGKKRGRLYLYADMKQKRGKTGEVKGGGPDGEPRKGLGEDQKTGPEPRQ